MHVSITPGAVSGSVCGIIAILARASTLPGGLDNFLLNTSEGYTVLAGSCTSFFVTLLITIVVSLCTHSIKTEDDSHREWQKVGGGQGGGGWVGEWGCLLDLLVA